MRHAAWIALVFVLAACGNGGDTSSPMGEVIDAATPGDVVTIEGEVSLYGDLLCPCFQLSDGDAAAVVWYDLMGEEGGAVPAESMAGVANGVTATVTGTLQADPDPGSGLPVVWATAVSAEGTGLANPASVYCEEQGGVLELRETAEGTTGYCIFPDGSECEEWAFFRGECSPGG